MRNISDKCFMENQNKCFIFNNFFKKIGPFLDTVEKCGTARQVTDDKNGACALHAG
jgi:hypothetical protein